MKLKNLKKYYFNSFIIFISIATYILLIQKFNNFGFSNYDFGIFFNKVKFISDGNYSYLFHGHSNFFLLFFAIIKKFISLKATIYISLLFKVICILILCIWIKKYLDIYSSLAYLSFFPVWFILLTNYKIDYLIIPLSFFCFYYLNKKKYFQTAILSFLIILLKEFYASFVFCLGFYLLLSRDKNKIDYLFAISLIIISCLLFFYFTHYVILTSAWNNEVNNNDNFYDKNIFKFFLSFPNLIFDNLFQDRNFILTKIKFYLYPFLSLLFINFFFLKYLIFFFPIFLLSVLSPDLNHSGYGHHYYAMIIAPSIYAFYDFTRSKKTKNLFFKTKNLILIFLLASNVLISPSFIGRLFWTDKIEKYNYKIYLPKNESKNLRYFLKNNISSDLVIVSQNNVLNENIIDQNMMLTFPQGVFNKFKMPKYNKKKQNEFISADVIILNLNKEFYLIDRSCEKIFETCTNKKIETEFNNFFVKLKNNFKIIYNENGIYVFRKKT